MRTVTPMGQAERRDGAAVSSRLAPIPPPPADRGTLTEEVVVVLMLSLLASAVYAILSLLEAPLAGKIVASANQSTQLARQLAGFVFGLAPVFLVVHLVCRSGEGVAVIGLADDRPVSDLARGLLLFSVVGVAGFGVYLAAVELGVNRFVIPAPPLGHWWTVPITLLSAIEAALVEEVIVLGYLVTRLRQLSWSPVAAVVGSSALRASYHLYQGWGGFLGNLVEVAVHGIASTGGIVGIGRLDGRHAPGHPRRRQ